jgi:hypothetical protein
VISTVSNESSKTNDSNEDDNKSLDQYDSASSTISGNSMDIDQHFNDHKKLLSNAKASTLVSTSKSDDKHMDDTSLPAEWMSTIKKDLERQHQMNGETRSASFSDAYMNGMPSKRRRILTARTDLVAQNLFKKVLTKTMEQMRMKPNVNLDDMVRSSVNQSELISNFEEHFEGVITERLHQDQDYIKLTTSSANSNSDEAEKKKESEEKGNDSNIFNNDRLKFSRKRFK